MERSPKTYSRRNALRYALKLTTIAVAVGPIALLEACANTTSPQNISTIATPGLTPTATLPETTSNPSPKITSTATPHIITSEKFKFILGPKEKVTPEHLSYTPDGHISYLKQAGQAKMWLPAARSSFLLEGPDINHLTLYSEKFGQENLPKAVLGPNTSKGDGEDYASFGSVLPGDNKGNTFVGFYHIEHWRSRDNGFPFRASIGRAISTDGGHGWSKNGEVITGKKDTAPKDLPDDKPRGAGIPCALIIGDKIHLYYVDWNEKDPDAIHLAIAPLSSGGIQGSWKKFYKGNFSEDGLGGNSTPIISPKGPNMGYTSMPGISHNTVLNRFLGIYESNDGFYITTSHDGIDWGYDQKVFDFAQPQFPIRTGETWESYPTLISPNTNSHLKTSDEGFLYFSEGQRGTPHYMYRMPYRII